MSTFSIHDFQFKLSIYYFFNVKTRNLRLDWKQPPLWARFREVWQKINNCYLCTESQEKTARKYPTGSDPSERCCSTVSINSTRLVSNKTTQPFGKQHTNFWSRCPVSPLTDPHSAVFWRRIEQFLCYWHLDSGAWKSQNKCAAAFIWPDIKRVQMTEEENVSLLCRLNDLSSVVLDVAIKLRSLFSGRLIGNSWNSERPAALNVFRHRRISSDTSFLWPDSSELRNESLNFNSLGSESFWLALRRNSVVLQFTPKPCPASHYKHRAMVQCSILQQRWP